MKLRHICEVCGKDEVMTPDEAYHKGWDYPPMMGQFGIVSPRTCGDCMIDNTVWYKLTMKNQSVDSLTNPEKATINRILAEPESIMVEE